MRLRAAVTQPHCVGTVLFLREVDDLGIVRLAQQLGEPRRLERLTVGARHVRHGLAQLIGVDGILAAQPLERVLEHAEGLGEREPAAACAVLAAAPAAWLDRKSVV